jgi:outer membrane protein
MKCISISALMIVCLASGNAVLAQKFGHVHSAQLVESHPKVATANVELEAYRKTMTDPFEAKAKAFQSKYQFFMEEMQAGTLSKVSAQTRQAELQKEQQDLGKEEQQIQFAVMQKREQLLQPILVELDSLIQLVGREGKYTMIFDNSANGVLLHAPEGENLTETVRARIKED